MPALGLVLAWGGYWFLAYGLALRKNANVTLVDMALPSHRATVTAELAKAWAAPAQGSSPSSGSGSSSNPFGMLPGIGIPGTNIRVPIL